MILTSVYRGFSKNPRSYKTFISWMCNNKFAGRPFWVDILFMTVESTGALSLRPWCVLSNIKFFCWVLLERFQFECTYIIYIKMRSTVKIWAYHWQVVQYLSSLQEFGELDLYEWSRGQKARISPIPRLRPATNLQWGDASMPLDWQAGKQYHDSEKDGLIILSKIGKLRWNIQRLLSKGQPGDQNGGYRILSAQGGVV